MRLIVKQYQQNRIVWFVPQRRRNITERDRARVAPAVAANPSIEQGYYDLVLVDCYGQEHDATIEIK